MAVAQTNTTMTGLLTVQLKRQFTPILRNKLQLAKFAEDGVLTPRAGFNTLRWLQATDIGVFTTGLTEASATVIGDSAVEVATVTITYIETTVSNYGAFCRITDIADAMFAPEARAQFRDIFAYSAAKTIDSLVRGYAYGTTTAYCARTGATGTTNYNLMTTTSTLRPEDLGYIAGAFHQSDVEYPGKLGDSFAIVISGKTEQDLKTYCSPVTTGSGKMEWWNLAAQQPPGWEDLKRGYIATLLEMSVFRSNNLTTTTNTNTVTLWRGVATGAYGFGKCSIDMMEPDIILKTSGPQDTSNPLNMFSTLGFKVRMGGKLIQSAACMSVYSGI